MRILIASTLVLVGTMAHAAYELGSGKTRASYLCDDLSTGYQVKVTPIDGNTIEAEVYLKNGGQAGVLAEQVLKLTDTVGYFKVFSNLIVDGTLKILISDPDRNNEVLVSAEYTDKKSRYVFPRTQERLLTCYQ